MAQPILRHSRSGLGCPWRTCGDQIFFYPMVVLKAPHCDGGGYQVRLPIVSGLRGRDRGREADKSPLIPTIRSASALAPGLGRTLLIAQPSGRKVDTAGTDHIGRFSKSHFEGQPTFYESCSIHDQRSRIHGGSH